MAEETEEKKEERKEEEQKSAYAEASADKQVDFKKRTKNYLSIIILLAGLLIGSIFVDVAQFVSRQ